MNEFYISIDLEANGPCPGIHSMLQFGAVFYREDGTVIDEYAANIAEIPGGHSDTDTLVWWGKQEIKHPGIWNRMRENVVSPKTAMEQFEAKVKTISMATEASPICFAYPSGYDFTWLYYYLYRFLGRSCVGHACIDVKSMAMAFMKQPYTVLSKKTFPKHWKSQELKHTHNALDDAREQGYLFFQMMKTIFAA